MRIAGITLPNKQIPYALTALYGIGFARATKICATAKIDLFKRADELTADEENQTGGGSHGVISDSCSSASCLRRTA